MEASGKMFHFLTTPSAPPVRHHQLHWIMYGGSFSLDLWLPSSPHTIPNATSPPPRSRLLRKISWNFHGTCKGKMQNVQWSIKRKNSSHTLLTYLLEFMAVKCLPFFPPFLILSRRKLQASTLLFCSSSKLGVGAGKKVKGVVLKPFYPKPYIVSYSSNKTNNEKMRLERRWMELKVIFATWFTPWNKQCYIEMAHTSCTYVLSSLRDL